MIVLYGVLAFATQPLTGRLIDQMSAHPCCLKLAVALLVFGAIVILIPRRGTLLLAIMCATLMGMGNSFFHVYGGKYVAISSRNDIRAMGVFVSTGAVGLAIGTGFYNLLLLSIFIIALLSTSVLHLRIAEGRMSAKVEGSSPIRFAYRQKKVLPLSSLLVLYLSCLMLVVAGQACIGESLPHLHSNPTCQALLMPLVATILLESIILLFLREHRWQVLAASVVLNILTNIPLNAFVFAFEITSPLYLIGLECVVVMVEFAGYWLVLRDRYMALKYSFLCNTFSALTGCISQVLFY